MIGRATRVALGLVGSVTILALVVYLIGFEATAEAVVQAGFPAFLATGGLLVALLALQAAAWAALNRGIGHRMPFVTLLEATTVGQAGNILTPSTYLGGEPAKVFYAGRRTGLSYQELAGTVLLAKYLEALSFVLFLGVGTITAAVGFRHVLFRAPNLALGIAAIVLVAAALGLCILLWLSLWRNWTPLTALVSLLARIRLGRRFFARLRRRAAKMERQASRVFREEANAVVPAFGLYVLTHVAIFLKPLAFFFLGWRIGLGLAELGLLFLTCQVLLALQLTPSGVGTLDGGLLGMLALAGIAITRPQCAAFLLCIRFWDAAVIGVGALLAARVGAGLFRPRPADPTDPATAEP